MRSVECAVKCHFSEHMMYTGKKTSVSFTFDDDYHKVHKFSDARKPCCNQPKIQTEMPNLRVFHQNDANGKQAVKTLIRLLLWEQSDLGLHCSPRPICPKI